MRSKEFRILFLLLFLAVGARAEADRSSSTEQFDYRWTLAGFKGVFARLFIPGSGEGRLTTAWAGDGGSLDSVKTELLISSSARKRDEFWLYGAEIDSSARRTVRSWSSQRFRGKSRRREREAGDVDALDLASSIFYLRRERPDQPREEMIWSKGKLNPVMIHPGPSGSALWNGEQVATRSYSIRGLSKPGRPTWEGMMDLILTDDEEAVPLEIVVVRKGLRIRLELVPASD